LCQVLEALVKLGTFGVGLAGLRSDPATLGGLSANLTKGDEESYAILRKLVPILRMIE
jgi:hypothetical protein